MTEKLFDEELTNYRSDLDFFVKLFLNKKLPQSLLLTGEKGIGKLNFAYHLAFFILSQNDTKKYDLKSYQLNPSTKTYKLLLQNTHPNFHLIKPIFNKNYIEIAQIKRMQNFLNMSSFNNMPKIVLINECEYLNVSSSNSLLKSLEEKYENVFFILI